DAIGATINITGASANAGQINAINSTLNLPGGLSGNGQVNLINTTLNTSGGAVAGASLTSGGASVLAGRMSGGNLNIGSGALTIAAASGTSVMETLAVGAGSRLDLKDNSLVI